MLRDFIFHFRNSSSHGSGLVSSGTNRRHLHHYTSVDPSSGQAESHAHLATPSAARRLKKDPFLDELELEDDSSDREYTVPLIHGPGSDSKSSAL